MEPDVPTNREDEHPIDGVDMLNALSHQYNRWQVTTSNRYDRTDVFGVHIPKGQWHFKLGIGTGEDVERLSQASMNTFVQLLFSRNSGLRDLAKNAYRMELRATLEKLGHKFRSESA